MPKLLLSAVVLLYLVSCGKEEVKAQPPAEKSPVPVATLEQVVALLEKPSPVLVDALNSLNLTLEEPPDLYKNIFKSCKIRESYLTSNKFTLGDLYYIMQAAFMHKSAKEAIAYKPPEQHIPVLFELVKNKVIKPVKGQRDQSAYPLAIAQRGFGVCDRQAWVLCELAYQIGADCYIIYLMDPDTGVSHHTICEVKYNNKSYILDPMYDKFIDNRTLTELSEKEIAQVWSDYPQLHKEFKPARVFSPSMPQDYSARFKALNKFLAGKAPYRIAEDPQERAVRRGQIKGERFAFWDYPIRLLLSFKPYNDSK